MSHARALLKVLVASQVTVVVACGSPDRVVEGSALDGPMRGRGNAIEGDCPAPHVLYLNRSGGTYHPGDDDSLEDRSAIVRDGPREMTAPEIDDASWSSFVEGVRERFAAFHHEVTDAPPQGDHTELVVIESAQQLDLLPFVASAGHVKWDACPQDNGRVVHNGVVFLMWNALPDIEARVQEAAQAVGRSYGLESVVGCDDVMSMRQCDDVEKAFLDAEVACGGVNARPCTCGETAQNSAQRLEDAFGPACGG